MTAYGFAYECKMPGCTWTSRSGLKVSEKMQAFDHRRDKGHDTRLSKDRPVAYPPKEVNHAEG
jgi:hypothetical protein